MATSLGIVVLLGMAAQYTFTKLHLPGLLGMLLVGMVLGPYGLNLIDADMMRVSADFRKLALIVILLRAGLGISKEDVKAVGVTALKLSILPGLLEGFTVMGIAYFFLDFHWAEAGVLGFILAAVSPAVIVPHMLMYQVEGWGAKKRIPTMILAGASIDDVIAITLFSSFLGFASGQNIHLGVKLLSIPLAILLGVALGALVGIVMVKVFEKHHMRDTKKVMLILGVAIMMTALEQALKSRVEMASLLGVMALGYVILEKRPHVAKRLSAKFNKIWLFAEILLFVLVGAQVDTALAWQAGLVGLLLVGLGLFSRSIGVWIATMGSDLNPKERWFTTIAYWPKATVQAAIGAIPLAYGLDQGQLILALAVLSILFTAPLGSLGMDLMHKRLLVKES